MTDVSLERTEKQVVPEHKGEQREQEQEPCRVRPADNPGAGLAAGDAFPDQEHHVSAVENWDGEEVQNCEVNAEESEEADELENSPLSQPVTDPSDGNRPAE